MSINFMFKKVHDHFKNGDTYNALSILRNVWLKYPKNKKIFEEIHRFKKKTVPQINTILNQDLIKSYFELHHQGKTFQVINDLEFLFSKNPKDFYVLNLLGTFNGLMGEFDNAIKYQKLSIDLNPFDGNNYFNLGVTLEQKGNPHLSLHHLEIGKLLDFDNININKQLAKLYYMLNKYSLSVSIYEELIKLKKDDISIKLDYARSLIKSESNEKALILLRTIKYNKNYHDKVLTLKSLAYINLDNISQAQENLNQAIKENPKNSDAHTILGVLFERLNNIYKAIECHERATFLNDKNYTAFNNLGACYSFIGNIDLSILNFKKAIEIVPFFYDGIYRLGQMQIYNQEFKEGWKNFKKRWQSSDYSHRFLKTSKPIFKNIKNQRVNVLAWGEQGLGDQVMYGSMFNDFSKLTSKLIIKLDKRLINIFQNKHPNIQFSCINDEVSEETYDEHIPFGHMGNYLRLNKTDFLKTNFPYIAGQTKTKELIINKYKKSNNLLVGISWSSSNQLLSNNKSLSLEILYPILKIKNITFIDLEYKDGFEEINNFYYKYGIKILKEETIDNFNDIEGLCSIIESCDFIISCSNTNAHLAGALFKKTYLLLAKGKGRLWNWNSHKGKSLWYPETKIFEQKTVGDWSYPVKKLETEILNNEIKVK